MRNLSMLVKIVAICTAWYLTGSFIAADFNIEHWSGFGRYLTGMAMVVSSTSVVILNKLK